MSDEEEILFDIEVTELTELDLLRKIYKATFHIKDKLHNMQIEIQNLIDGAAKLEDKVEALKIGYAHLQLEIGNLNTTIAGLGLSDADEAQIQTALKAIDTEAASVDAILNPVA